jgi:hypothetical protein
MVKFISIEFGEVIMDSETKRVIVISVVLTLVLGKLVDHFNTFSYSLPISIPSSPTLVPILSVVAILVGLLVATYILLEIIIFIDEWLRKHLSK